MGTEAVPLQLAGPPEAVRAASLAAEKVEVLGVKGMGEKTQLNSFSFSATCSSKITRKFLDSISCDH